MYSMVVSHIVAGTLGRILALAREKDLHFILDECDKMLESLGKFFLVQSF